MRPLYDREAVKPLWEELAAVGVTPLTTADDVDAVLSKTEGTALVIVNSVCGCAAGNARPGLALALQNKKIPDTLTTVFAGVDMEATQRAREYMKGIAPSSPSIALFKDGKLVYMLERKHIEGNSPQVIAEHLRLAFDQTCTKDGPSVPYEQFVRVFGPAYDPACGTTFRIIQS